MRNERARAGATTVSPTAGEAAASAATAAAEVIVTAVAERGSATVVFASAPSQELMLAALGADPRVDWTRVRSLHMDEYLGLDHDHPQAFGQWLRDRLPAEALPGLHRIRADGDPEAEARRYAELVAAGNVDLVCLGMGVNGHIAFNEPGIARFDDDALARVVELAEVSRIQQADEGLFPSADDVPTHAITLTVPALLGARTLVATVLGAQKARAVADALEGPVTPECPASALRTHADVSVHLDDGAATMLTASSGELQ
ncbi:glucosamine-6-phosphate deaminase [Haloactinopolyspora alba]|uniref:Glucosamine-6-phosphate deaminase n=1 Tax=Haloactinopolyspora alba TaxID=648780 RepID=A0A2P8DT95_9ACTN|nr:6-phosphogluconolactonase [Haloactinopolyspora alba]PSL00431.1 glucosamine-6-phosphate deaminase [Haloactinopolyspora alba]